MSRLIRARVGFTVVELIVTIALLGVIGTIVSRMMLSQQRFYQQTNEQMGIRRELRAALSILPADLRSISSVGGDITAFDNSSITFRSTFGAAIICAKPNTTTMDLPPLNMARTTLTSWFTTPAVGDSVFAFRADSMGAGGDSWTAHRITAVTQDPSYCAGSPYTDAVLDLGKARWRLTVSPAIADSVKVGAAIRFERPTKYSLTVGATGNYYLGRSEMIGGVWSTPTAIAGPFNPPASNVGSMRFTMYDSTGSVVPTGGNANSISRIDLLIRAQGASTSGGSVGLSNATDSIAFRIALRNRQ